MLRTATGLSRPMFIILASERYRLDPALIDVDLWRFEAALDQARTTAAKAPAGGPAAGRRALPRPAGGRCCLRLGRTLRRASRRRAVDALARIAEILQPTDPEQSLSALEAALAHDPYNERSTIRSCTSSRPWPPYASLRTLRSWRPAGRTRPRPYPPTLQAAVGARGIKPPILPAHSAHTSSSHAKPPPLPLPPWGSSRHR